MAKRKKLCNTILILVLLFILFFAARSKQNGENPSPTIQSLAAQYAERGPYQAGTQDLKIAHEKPLDITIWYPTMYDQNQKQEITYLYEIKLGKHLGGVAIDQRPIAAKHRFVHTNH